MGHLPLKGWRVEITAASRFAEELAQRWCLMGCLCKRHESVGVPNGN
jgi:hypothetical protein